jgi:hypothetical protein
LDAKDRQAWLEKFVEGFMFHDVDACINGGANFAAALTLNVYTDALGGLIKGQLAERNVSEPNYTAFLSRMGYTPDECHEYYVTVRCGLAHQYFIKGENTIGNMTLALGGKGIRKVDDVLYFINKTYFDEFKTAYFAYKTELLAGTSPLPVNFDQALSHPNIPYEAKAYNPSTIVPSAVSSSVSTSILIFVPSAGPMPPLPAGAGTS